LLRSYDKALHESNEGSIVKIGVSVNPNEKTYFDRFYVCFQGLKEVGRDGNNHIIRYGGVSVYGNYSRTKTTGVGSRTTSDDLELSNDFGLSIMFLITHGVYIEVLRNVMPLARAMNHLKLHLPTTIYEDNAEKIKIAKSKSLMSDLIIKKDTKS
ncbi:hypothetical protein Tco_1251282, partial [Tanacetum coccineum]